MLAKLGRAGAVTLIAAWFLFVSRRAFGSWFNFDDVSNLYRAWELPAVELVWANAAFWTDHIRPLGDLFYRTLFAAFGLNPVPYRIGAYALLLVDIVLVFALARRILGRVDAALVAMLIAAFHGSCWVIYSSTGSIYDILSQLFVLVSLLLYAGGDRPNWWIVATTILAIDAKEMGLAIPLLLVAYDVVYRRALRWYPFALAAIPAIFLLSRFAFVTRLTGHPAYTPSFAPSRFLETTTAYVRFLLFDRVPVNAAGALAGLLAALAIAVALRSRHMIFGWLYYVIALLPMSFVTARDNGYPLFIALPGVALYLSGACLLFKKPYVPEAALALLVAFAQLKMMQSVERRLHWSGPFQPQVRATLEQLPRIVRRIRPGAHVLLVNDPFGGDPWLPVFAVRLAYGERNIEVERAAAAAPKYDHVFVWDGRAWSTRQTE